jgi:hypothetical protein
MKNQHINQPQSKKNKLVALLLVGFLALIFLPLCSAEIQTFQYKDNYNGTGIVKTHIYLSYQKGKFTPNGIDYVSGNNQFQPYFYYDIYVRNWNAVNSADYINYCNFRITFLSHAGNLSTIIYDKNYTSLNEDVRNAQYFIPMVDNDKVMGDISCYFNNTNYTGLDIPASLQVVLPSFECQACQYYKWTIGQADITKAEVIGNNVVSVSTYIKKLFEINFEILLALFWIFLISMALFSFGMIFIGVYWLYLYIRHLGK